MRFIVIDLMYNLFLGIVKYVFKLWVKNNFLIKKEFKVLEEYIYLFDVGIGVG